MNERVATAEQRMFKELARTPSPFVKSRSTGLDRPVTPHTPLKGDERVARMIKFRAALDTMSAYQLEDPHLLYELYEELRAQQRAKKALDKSQTTKPSPQSSVPRPAQVTDSDEQELQPVVLRQTDHIVKLEDQLELQDPVITAEEANPSLCREQVEGSLKAAYTGAETAILFQVFPEFSNMRKSLMELFSNYMEWLSQGRSPSRILAEALRDERNIIDSYNRREARAWLRDQATGAIWPESVADFPLRSNCEYFILPDGFLKPVCGYPTVPTEVKENLDASGGEFLMSGALPVENSGDSEDNPSQGDLDGNSSGDLSRDRLNTEQEMQEDSADNVRDHHSAPALDVIGADAQMVQPIGNHCLVICRLSSNKGITSKKGETGGRVQVGQDTNLDRRRAEGRTIGQRLCNNAPTPFQFATIEATCHKQLSNHYLDWSGEKRNQAGMVSAHQAFLKLLPAGSEVTICIRSLDGLTTNIDSLWTFVQLTHKKYRLKAKLI
jgi:hypothetical protein